MSQHLIATTVVLLSAALHAAWNAVVKASAQTRSAGVVVLSISGILAVLCSLALRGSAFPEIQAVWWSLLAGLFEAGYFLTLVWCLHLGPLSQVYSFSRGGSLLVAWPLSVLFMAEPLVGLHLVGAGVVLVGLSLAGYTPRSESLGWRYATALVCCAACIAGYHLLYKKALMLGGHPVAVFAVSMALAAPVNIFWHREQLSQEWSELKWPVLLPAGVLCTASFLLALLGLKLAGTGWVLTLRNTSVVMALLLAWRMGEQIPRQRAAGTVLIALGAVVLSWPG